MRGTTLAWRETLRAIIASRELLVAYYGSILSPSARGHRADAQDRLDEAQTRLDEDRAALAALDNEHTSAAP